MAKLNKSTEESGFWENRERAAEISKRISDIREEISHFQDLKKELDELEELSELSSDSDSALVSEIKKKAKQLEKEIEKQELKAFLSGKYDKNNAILQIMSGAGGIDAQDWAVMLLRMYERYCINKNWQIKTIDQSFGEGVGPDNRIGIKSAVLEIKGQYAYGFLKKETGVHRLVRISPFSAQGLRHTSFAMVEVLPEIEDKEKKEIEIKEDDIKISFFRSSGPGGQNVNKRETAVRIVHLSTNISVSSQSERSQIMNKEKAMKILYAKLSQVKKAEKKQEIEQIKGKSVSAAWGNQIRSYVLHPYKLVKDLRTGKEIKDVEAVLNGEIEELIKEELKRV